ncbi:MAG: tetratricopeptide repeat protein [Prevotellaceae bacterium]|nr:tetratricopeptide repeat protein [Prevotellaceae bacterium]MDD6780726.1 tetratricopeptide repeat protein [Prevotellaceae bacterium]
MNITELINHPEKMDRDTLYELRSTLALYPYFQTARILMLQNLFLLHDPSFDEELRRAAIYISDRKVLFRMVEAAHYGLRNTRRQSEPSQAKNESRTISLIDNFLDNIPAETTPKEKRHRRPTPADATVDYVAYLMELDESEEQQDDTEKKPQLKGQSLIDNFIEKDNGKIVLSDTVEFTPELDNNEGGNDEKQGEEGFFTETLARIYIKQGRYSKALEIIQRLSLIYPKKNAYFADQIRFLQKLILNNNKK